MDLDAQVGRERERVGMMDNELGERIVASVVEAIEFNIGQGPDSWTDYIRKQWTNCIRKEVYRELGYVHGVKEQLIEHFNERARGERK